MLAEQMRRAPGVPVPGVSEIVMAGDAVVTMLPPASVTDTTGWPGQGVPAVDPLGWLVKARCAGGPTVTARGC